MAYIREYFPGGGCMGFPSIKSSYAYMVVRPSSCDTSSEGHCTSFTTKYRSYVLPAVNFKTKFREVGEIAPKGRDEGEIG